MPARRLTLALLLLITAALALPSNAARAAGPTRADCLAGPNNPGCTAGLPSVEYQMLLDEMLLHPEPNVRPLAVNQDELSRFAFRKIVGGAATIYNGPGGEPIGQVGKEGNVSGCHLHFEVHLKNGSIYGPDNADPSTWLAENASKPTRSV